MPEMPKLKDGYYYRVVIRDNIPYLAVCRTKMRGFFKRKAVAEVQCKVPVLVSAPGMEREYQISARTMKEVFPKFFVHSMNGVTSEQLNETLWNMDL